MNAPATPSRRVLKTAIVGGVLASAVAMTTGTAAAYPPDPGEEALRVTILDPICELDAPFVQYEVEPDGFTSTGPMAVTVRDLDGVEVDAFESSSLSGSFLYPGASVDADGNATDWPGWTEVDGVWVEDPADDHLRDGVNVTFDVNPSVTQFVAYPAADSGCASPAGVQAGIVNAPAQQGTLPSTGGSGVSTTLLAAGLALLAGLGLTGWSVLTKRRSDVDTQLG